MTVFLIQFVSHLEQLPAARPCCRIERLYPVTLGLFTWQSQTSRPPELQTSHHRGAPISSRGQSCSTFLLLQSATGAPDLAAGAVKSVNHPPTDVTRTLGGRLRRRLQPEQWPRGLAGGRTPHA
ncbi:hypothetical protein LV779_12790 [Streptomyces thinghirensis]|nr:hypothetical protein [Streptomyces thinghirensis]